MTKQELLKDIPAIPVINYDDAFKHEMDDDDKVLMCALRPLIGKYAEGKHCYNGRHLALVNLSFPNIEKVLRKNVALEGKIIVNMTRQEVVELALSFVSAKYQEKYREKLAATTDKKEKEYVERCILNHLPEKMTYGQIARA